MRGSQEGDQGQGQALSEGGAYGHKALLYGGTTGVTLSPSNGKHTRPENILIIAALYPGSVVGGLRGVNGAGRVTGSGVGKAGRLAADAEEVVYHNTRPGARRVHRVPRKQPATFKSGEHLGSLEEGNVSGRRQLNSCGVALEQRVEATMHRSGGSEQGRP